MSAHSLSLTDIVATLGLISGVAGTILGVLNFLRDKAKIEVSLQWDMSVTPGSGYDHTKKWGVIRVTNIGRRPIFVSHVALRVPKGHDHSHLAFHQGMAGKTLTEGSPSEIYVIPQDGLDAYKTAWQDVIAQISDAHGREWKSRRLPNDQRPSWANAPH